VVSAAAALTSTLGGSGNAVHHDAVLVAAVVAAFGVLWSLWLWYSATHKARTHASLLDAAAHATDPDRANIEVSGSLEIASIGSRLRDARVQVYSGDDKVVDGVPGDWPTDTGTVRVRFTVLAPDRGEEELRLNVFLRFDDGGKMEANRTLKVLRPNLRT
jgi:hypothetical protein